MPLLNATTLPVSPVPVAVERIRAKLAAATGTGSVRLLQSLEIANDSVLNDATNTVESACPCGFLSYQSTRYATDGRGNNLISSLVPISLYVIYYVGTGAALGVVRTPFTELRQRHIDWLLEHLKDSEAKPNAGIGLSREDFLDSSNSQFWMFNGGAEFEVDNDTPFKYFDQSQDVSLPSGFTCSRIDFSISVDKHATFN